MREQWPPLLRTFHSVICGSPLSLAGRLLPHFLLNRPSRRTSVAAAGAALVAAIALFTSAQSDFDDSRTRIEAERIRCWELDEGFQLSDARLAIKRFWIEELIVGRADLAAVVGRFIEADRDCPGCIAALEHKYPGSSDEEKASRSALAFLRIRIERAPASAESWARVMAQFRSRHDAFVDELGPSLPVSGQVQAPISMPLVGE